MPRSLPYGDRENNWLTCWWFGDVDGGGDIRGGGAMAGGGDSGGLMKATKKVTK